MIEKGKISAFQMGIIFYPTIIATAILSVPAGTAEYAKNDMWLSPIWASLIGFITVYIACKLHKLYPKLTMIQYSEKILGKVLGKIYGILLIVNFLFTNGFTTRQYTDLVTGAFLSQTPMIVVSAALIIVCSLAVYGGLEVIGRASQIFIPLYIFSLFIIIVTLVPEYNFKNILPVMENGLMPSIKGAAVSQSMFTLYIFIAYILPYLTNKEKGQKWGMISVCAVMLTLVITNLTTLLVFGDATGRFTYPVLSAARYISIADFFQYLESVVMAIWVAGTFIKLSVQYYITVIATAQFLGLSNYRPIVLPIGFISLLFSMWGIPNFSYLAHVLGTTLPFLAFYFNLIIPFCLLIIAHIRIRKGKQVQE